uniref:Ras-associated and pleckstrin homology domains-containing protein 1-like n=1 Tax=Saccoglossus kowalevskii TaxID=10224 RepID=A0ABM0MDL1_SACKO|nr:PREDICTED: ras-associated and pleckstrin homology domains-containing protein 1-like [Saccoglossus kowalevskii]
MKPKDRVRERLENNPVYKIKFPEKTPRQLLPGVSDHDLLKTKKNQNIISSTHSELYPQTSYEEEKQIQQALQLSSSSQSTHMMPTLQRYVQPLLPTVQPSVSPPLPARPPSPIPIPPPPPPPPDEH